MKKTYFGFALADGMFAGEVTITRRSVTVEEVRQLVKEGVVPCLNPSHGATIAAMKDRYGIEVAIPDAPPRVELAPGDSVIVMGVRGLPRLTGRHEYTSDEIAQASFVFTRYSVSTAS